MRVGAIISLHWYFALGALGVFFPFYSLYLRENAGLSGTEVGLAENAVVVCPVLETPEHIEAAHKATRDLNAPFLTTLLDGRYPDSYLLRERANATNVEEGDMKAIGSPLDFVGLNIYVPLYARADGSAQGYAIEPMPTSYPHNRSRAARNR